MTSPIAELVATLGDPAVNRDPAALRLAGRDRSESPPGMPDAIVRVTNLHDLRAVVGIAARGRIPLIPRIAGTNLTFPEGGGGWILDLATMNRICELDERSQVAVLEPGVTFGQLAAVLDERHTGLTIGVPLSPYDVSIVATCLLDGLGSLSLRHGPMGEWLTGLEVVRADGSLLRTGSWAAGAPPFARAPLPDLTGLFVSMQGATGFVSKAAVRLWPAQAASERWFLLFFDRRDAFRALGELPRLDILDDAGALFWPAGKMLLGVDSPRDRDPAEPEVIAYLELGACDRDLLAAKRAVIERHLARARRAGARFEGPIAGDDLAAVNPHLARFVRYPTRLDFLLDRRQGGVSWISAYGPIDGVSIACDAGISILADHGLPPLIVARPMRAGQFAVLRFIEVFDAASDADRARVLACNQALCDMLRPRGFVMYKTPGWAVDRYRAHLDPGFTRLLGEVKQLLDPTGIMNPGRWDLK
jgi:FAD/FMN-containing dehydrogenase